jgi:hypothetical protein
MQYDKLTKILDVCSDFKIILKKSGDKYWARCPIHHEKTASFTISMDGRFKCYGCGAGPGDAIDLYVELTASSFLEAKKALGLWESRANGYKAPPPKPRPRWPDVIETEDKKKAYIMARDSMIAGVDTKIKMNGTQYLNHEFVIKSLFGHPRESKMVGNIYFKMRKRSEISAELFLNLWIGG